MSCVSCNQENTIVNTSEGFFVCTECGVIQQNHVVVNDSEWTENGSKSTHSVDGSVVCGKTSAKGGKNASKLNNIDAIATSDYYQTESRKVKQFFREVCDRYNFSEIVCEKAFSIYKKVYNKTNFNGKKEIHRGRTLDGIKGACLYLSLNSQVDCINNPKRTPREVSKMLNIDTKSINSGRKKISFDLDIETNTITYKDLVPIFIERINKTKGVKIPFYISQRTVTFIENKLKEGYFKNNISKSISAGVLYYILHNQTNLFNNKSIDDKIFQSVTDVSLNTILRISKYLN